MHFVRHTDIIAIATRAYTRSIRDNFSKPLACFWSKFFQCTAGPSGGGESGCIAFNRFLHEPDPLVGNSAFRHLASNASWPGGPGFQYWNKWGGLAVDGRNGILLRPVTADLLPEIAFRMHATASGRHKPPHALMSSPPKKAQSAGL